MPYQTCNFVARQPLHEPLNGMALQMQDRGLLLSMFQFSVG